jgi:hypothetical protein
MDYAGMVLPLSFAHWDFAANVVESDEASHVLLADLALVKPV